MRLIVALRVILLAGPVFATAAHADDAGPFGISHVSDTFLAQVRGREDTSQVAINVLTNELANTSVGDNVQTGNVSFDTNAFSSLNGFALVNSNTGNNVSFNANMTVNVIVNN
ncbi:MAG: hypothetical protein ACFBZ9_08500 [Sphingomonadales bacterium]